MLYPIARHVDLALAHEWRDMIIFNIGGMGPFRIYDLVFIAQQTN
jgi:hypothetical protein